MSHKRPTTYFLAGLPSVLTLVLTLIFVPLVFAQDDALAELDYLLSDIHTLSADVTQLIMESDGGVLEESSIKMYLKKPGRFYWETVTPFPELIVTNGEKLWNYQPDLEQVVIEDWDRSRSELAAQLLNGETDRLVEEYAIDLVVDDANQKEFELTPLAADSIYEHISIRFYGPELDTIYLQHKNGERTVWRFENVMRNTHLADDLFEFDPPDNIEIIENSYVD